MTRLIVLAIFVGGFVLLAVAILVTRNRGARRKQLNRAEETLANIREIAYRYSELDSVMSSEVRSVLKDYYGRDKAVKEEW